MLIRTSRLTACSIALLVALLVVGSASNVDGQARQIGGVGLTVFVDANYRGRNATVRNDTPDLRSIGLDDNISSVRVGPGELWEACELPNYRGRCQVFSGAEPNLTRVGWNDTISSVRRVRSGGGGGVRPPILPPVASGTLQLFADIRFSGDRRAFNSPVPDLARIGFNNRAESLRLSRGQAWEVCSQANYRDCTVVNTDWADLSSLGLNRRISSLRPLTPGGVRPPPIGPLRLVLFDDRNFRGRSFVVDRALTAITGFANRAESVQVFGGVWQVCERANYAGRCVTVSSSVPDLGALRNRIGSARPVAAR